MRLSKILTLILVLPLIFIGGYLLGKSDINLALQTEIPLVNERPLDKYTIENLSRQNFKKGKLELGEIINQNENFTSYLFTFTFSPTLDDETKKVTGQINIPSEEGPHPLILMYRGYVDEEVYETGIGTRRAGEYYANNGFITLAPDFLGYAGSDDEAKDIFETRFQTYTTSLTLLNSLEMVEGWDKENLFLWGHSNGGQIAIITLETSGKNIPTTLWAPVTKAFPYSILYYTDEAEDKGKFLRRMLASFEQKYDADLYSPDEYFSQINAPLQIHQGTSDDAVPFEWTDEFVSKLEDLDKDVVYFKYPGADHNLNPSWDTVVSRDLEFFENHLR